MTDLMNIINCQTPTPPQDAVEAQKAWIEDGTVPAAYAQATVAVTFSTVQPPIIIASPIPQISQAKGAPPRK